MVTALRKRKDRERKERTREGLLDAAERVFTRQGYHPTLVSEIVAEAGVGQGTFYRNFESKREVFTTLFERFVETLLAEFSGMTVNLPRTVERYRLASLDAIRRMASLIEEHRDITLLFLREGPSIDREFEETLDGMYERFAQLAGFYLDHAVRQGFARVCDTRLVSQALVGVGLRMLKLWLSGRLVETTVEKAIAEVVDFAFMGFGIFDAETSAGARAPAS